MRRLTALVSTVLLALALAVGPALAHEGGNHDGDEVPEHPHAMLLNFELDDGGTPEDPSDDTVTFDRCIDLANGQELPLQAHHHSLHQGTVGAGDPSVGITRAGHLVVPLQPFPQSPFADCEDIEEFIS